MKKGLTIFTALKPMYRHWGLIQRNALLSWTRIKPRPEIIVFGHGDGIPELAQELDLRHVPVLVRNKFESPRLDSLLERIGEFATHRTRALVCADTILPDNFGEAVRLVQNRFPQFLVVGGSHSLDAAGSVQWSEKAPKAEFTLDLIREMIPDGALPQQSSQFFVFEDNIKEVPPIGLGGACWKNWFIADGLYRGVTIVDISKMVPTFNQLHDPLHSKWGSRERLLSSPETEDERQIAPETFWGELLPDVSWEMHSDGTIKLKPFATRSKVADKIIGTRRKAALLFCERLWKEGLKLDKEGRSAHGLLKIEKAIEVCPDAPGVHLFKAICLLNLKRYDEAISAASNHLEDPAFGPQAGAVIELARASTTQVKS